MFAVYLTRCSFGNAEPLPPARCSRVAVGDLDITLMLADGGGTGRADPAFDAHTVPI